MSAGDATDATARERRPNLRRGLWRLLRRPRNGEGTLRETLEELAERHEEDEEPLDPAERLIIENTLKLRSLTVEDVMVPRADVVAIDIEADLPELIARIRETHHSRLPVYRGDLDDVVGMIHVKDVLPHAGDETPPPLADLLRGVLFVVPSMRVLELLMQMRVSRLHMALVVDEYGGIDGLVTIEDVVEVIVGEIEDEHEAASESVLLPRPDGTLIADARVTLEEFEAMVGPVLSEEERDEIDTLGGLVVAELGRVPSRGELITHESGIEFEVLEGDPRRIKKLRVRNLPSREPAAPPAATGGRSPRQD